MLIVSVVLVGCKDPGNNNNNNDPSDGTVLIQVKSNNEPDQAVVVFEGPDQVERSVLTDHKGEGEIKLPAGVNFLWSAGKGKSVQDSLSINGNSSATINLNEGFLEKHYEVFGSIEVPDNFPSGVSIHIDIQAEKTISIEADGFSFSFPEIKMGLNRLSARLKKDSQDPSELFSEKLFIKDNYRPIATGMNPENGLNIKIISPGKFNGDVADYDQLTCFPEGFSANLPVDSTSSFIVEIAPVEKQNWLDMSLSKDPAELRLPSSYLGKCWCPVIETYVVNDNPISFKISLPLSVSDSLPENEKFAFETGSVLLLVLNKAGVFVPVSVLSIVDQLNVKTPMIMPINKKIVVAIKLLCRHEP